jgi:hypothetical protein
MVGASWRSDPSVQKVAGPPELLVESKIEANSEGTLSQPTGECAAGGVGSVGGRSLDHAGFVEDIRTLPGLSVNK